MFGNATNSIEPVKTPWTGRKQSTEEMPIREATRAEEDAVRSKQPAKPTEPDAIAKQHNLYTSDNRSSRVYYADYQQRSEVMRAAPDRITTRLDDRQTVSAVFDLAQSRSWNSIKLAGTEGFKREAWVQAQVRGIETTGYTPKETDIQEADRRKLAATPVQAPSKTVAESAAKPTAAPAKAAPKAAAPKFVKKVNVTASKPTVESENPDPNARQPVAQPKQVWGAVEEMGKKARQGETIPKDTTVQGAKSVTATAA